MPCTFDGWVPILDFFNMVLPCGLLGTKSCKSSQAFLIQCRVNCFAGTPEFMAEMKKNITSLLNFFFPLCLLEMVTSEYPSSECMNEPMGNACSWFVFLLSFYSFETNKKSYCQKEVYRGNQTVGEDLECKSKDIGIEAISG